MKAVKFSYIFQNFLEIVIKVVDWKTEDVMMNM